MVLKAKDAQSNAKVEITQHRCQGNNLNIWSGCQSAIQPVLFLQTHSIYLTFFPLHQG